MSQEIFPLAVWQSGTNENSIPANDNALRVEVLMGPALGFADIEPPTPSDGDQYVIGTAWGGFASNNVVIYKGGTWLEWEAFEGWVKSIAGTLSHFESAAWAAGTGDDGLPAGGVAGQVLAKASDTDYDVEWVDQAGGGGGAVLSVNGKTGAVVLTQGDIQATINDQTGASYTAELEDEVITMTNAAANTVTIPPESAVAFPVGKFLEVWQGGTGKTTIAAGSGVTILRNATLTLGLRGQNSGASLRKVAADTWRLVGDMETT